MLKKTGLIFLSALIMITSITLLISKPSYATEPINYCTDTIDYIKITGEKIDLIEGINLTTGIEGILKKDDYQSLGTLFFSKENRYSNYIWDYENNNKILQYVDVGNDYNSAEIGYLLTKLEFSDDEIENNYYQQLLLF